MSQEETDNTATGDVDPAAQALAIRLDGKASQTVAGFGNREFDTVSDLYIAQTTASQSAVERPDNFLTISRRDQIRATLAAAKQEGKTAYFEFTAGTPHPDIAAFIRRNAERLEAQAVIVYTDR